MKIYRIHTIIIMLIIAGLVYYWFATKGTFTITLPRLDGVNWSLKLVKNGELIDKPQFVRIHRGETSEEYEVELSPHQEYQVFIRPYPPFDEEDYVKDAVKNNMFPTYTIPFEIDENEALTLDLQYSLTTKDIGLVSNEKGNVYIESIAQYPFEKTHRVAIEQDTHQVMIWTNGGEWNREMEKVESNYFLVASSSENQRAGFMIRNEPFAWWNEWDADYIIGINHFEYENHSPFSAFWLDNLGWMFDATSTERENITWDEAANRAKCPPPWRLPIAGEWEQLLVSMGYEMKDTIANTNVKTQMEQNLTQFGITKQPRAVWLYEGDKILMLGTDKLETVTLEEAKVAPNEVGCFCVTEDRTLFQ